LQGDFAESRIQHGQLGGRFNRQFLGLLGGRAGFTGLGAGLRRLAGQLLLDIAQSFCHSKTLPITPATATTATPRNQRRE